MIRKVTIDIVLFQKFEIMETNRKLFGKAIRSFKKFMVKLRIVEKRIYDKNDKKNDANK